jgi:3-dehydroquinate dehydratase-2
MNVLVLHGPNLNLLGEREPDVYGRTTLAEVDASLVRRAREFGCQLKTFQSNSEGALVDRIHAERQWADVLLINPGALTHTSYVLHDAIAAVRMRTFEVHLSDIKKREPWRHKSLIRPACAGQVSGLGAESYLVALEQAVGRGGGRNEVP